MQDIFHCHSQKSLENMSLTYSRDMWKDWATTATSMSAEGPSSMRSGSSPLPTVFSISGETSETTCLIDLPIQRIDYTIWDTVKVKS